jgi:hypothetical protein
MVLAIVRLRHCIIHWHWTASRHVMAARPRLGSKKKKKHVLAFHFAIFFFVLVNLPSLHCFLLSQINMVHYL